MAKLNLSGFELISSLFSPSLAVFTTPDVEAICSKNNLNFVELIKPFSKVNKDVILKDPSNTNHSVKNLQIVFQYINGYMPQANEATKVLSDVVEHHWKEPVMTYLSSQSVNVTLPATTPWYDTYMHTYLATLPVSEHEFFRHCLGCVFIVSTHHPDPVQQFSRLTQQQNQLQMQQIGHGGHVRWFHHNIMKFYVLVHDLVDGPDKSKVDSWYQMMKSTYGVGHCHLLQINSRPSPSTGTDLNTQRLLCDPWQQFLLPIGSSLDGVVAPHLCNNQQTANSQSSYDPSHRDSIDVSDSVGVGPSSEVDLHPLSMNSEQEDLHEPFQSTSAHETYNKFGSAPETYSKMWPLLSISPFYTLVPCSSSMLTQTIHGQCLTEEDYERLRQFVYEMTVKALIPWAEKTMKSLHDQVANKLRNSRSIINVTRKWFGVGGGSASASTTASTVTSNSGTNAKLSPSNSISSLNSTLSSSSSTLGLGAQFYGSSTHSGSSGYKSGGLLAVHSAAEPLSSIVSLSQGSLSPSSSLSQLSSVSSVAPTHSQTMLATTASTTVYSQDAPEMQMRRYADIALLFQQYDVAHQSYDILRKDFKTAFAWLYYAGALEADAVCIFVQSQQNQYPLTNMDQAVSHYLHCRNVGFAARAVILHTQALQSRSCFADATAQYIKLTAEAIARMDPIFRNAKDCDLRSALFLEQSAHCHARLRVPMLRKYAFQLVMSGHRFAKCGQRQHSIRTYSQAYQVYQNRRWRFIEDHINRSLAQQSALLKQLPQALKHYQNMLTSFYDKSERNGAENNVVGFNQSPEMQNALLRDYLFIYKQYLQNVIGNENRLLNGSLPIVNLPLLKPSTGIQVMLGKPHQEMQQGRRMEARGVQFHDTDIQSTEWSVLEKLLVSNSLCPGEHISDNLLPPPPCMTQDTDNSKTVPKAVVGEPITVFIPLENPLQVPLLLGQVSLLWKLQSSSSNASDASVELTNEVECNLTQAACDACWTEVLEEVCLLPREQKSLQLSLIPKKPGVINIYAVGYQLCNSTARVFLPSTSSSPISDKMEMSVQGDAPMNGVLPGSSKSSSLPALERNTPPTSSPMAPQIWCKMNLLIRGRRLNTTKEQKASTLYAKDNRLNLEIVAPMPLLKVTFHNMPSSLLCGQVHPVQMEVTNAGSQPLKALCLAVNDPECITFGQYDWKDDSLFQENAFVYTMSPKKETTRLPSTLHDVRHDWMKLALPHNDTLLPGMSHKFTFWLRGYPNKGLRPPTSSGEEAANEDKNVLALRMLFYYEGLNPGNQLRYRLLRHRANIPLIASINLQAQAGRAKSGDPQSIFIVLQTTNSWIQKVQGLCQELQILQITGASSRWTIQPVSSSLPCDNGPIVLKENESLGLYLRGYPIDDRGEGAELCASENSSKPSSQVTFSDISWTDGQIHSSTSPAVDFYFRSRVPWYSKSSQAGKSWGEYDSDREYGFITGNYDADFMHATCDSGTSSLPRNAGEAFQVHLTLVVFWKVELKNHLEDGSLTSSSQMHGQTHIHIPFLDQAAYEPALLSVDQQFNQQKISFLSQFSPITNPRLQLQPLLLQSKMISLSLHHPSELEHNFTKQKLFIVPVEAKLYNASLLPTLVRLEGLGTDARLRRNTVVSQSVAIGLVSSQSAQFDEALTPQNHAGSPITFHGPSYSSALRSASQFSWVGLSQRQLVLQPHESHTVVCFACFPRPGTYELSHLDLKAALLPDNMCASDELTYVKQEAVYSSLIMIKAAMAQL